MKDWEDLSDTPKLNRGIFMSVIGEEGSGKSSFALTVPGPVAYVDIDQSVDRARRPKGSDVKVVRVRYDIGIGMDKDAIQKSCTDAWDTMEKKLRPAVDRGKGWAKSAVLDTGTEGWELRRFASFGTLTPRARRMDRLYGPVNAKFRQFLRHIYREHQRHLVAVHQTYDEYEDRMVGGEMTSVRTGRKVPKGFKEIGYLADIIVKTFRDDEGFKVEIVNAKLPPDGPHLGGVVLEGDDATFAGVVALCTNTGSEEWE